MNFSTNYFLNVYKKIKSLQTFKKPPTTSSNFYKNSIFRLLDIIWKRSMKPHYYYNSIYALTSLKKQEDCHRKFIFDFIANEWNKLKSAEHKSSMIENSFIQQLMKVSNNGRNYTDDEILDHCGTMLVAVSRRTHLSI